MSEDFEQRHPVLVGILFCIAVYALMVIWLGCA